MLENPGKPRTQCGKTHNVESKVIRLYSVNAPTAYIERHLNILGIGVVDSFRFESYLMSYVT